MFVYGPDWSDAAVRRFIRRIGVADVEALLDLRIADNVGSGLTADAGGLEELRARCREQLARRVALSRDDLVVDGEDLMKALGLAPGRAVGLLLDRLLERVLADPLLNERGRLVALARELAAGDAEAASGDAAGGAGDAAATGRGSLS
jgi:hypothetical protein